MKLAAKICGALMLLALITATYLYHSINDYQRSGSLVMSELDAPVIVHRDQLAIPYIEAQSLADALRAQGFITGQDRLYQAQLYRLLALGRLSEVFGERGLKNDIMIRTVGIRQIADSQTAALDQHARDYYTRYIEGLNAYIREQQHEHPLAVKMLGFPAEQWSLQDIVAVQTFQTWANGGNWRMDVLSQQMIDTFGPQVAQKIAQITINPDDDSMAIADLSSNTSSAGRHWLVDPDVAAIIPDGLAGGSNAWATGSRKSKSGKPIFSNSPHVPASTLPGFWHPIGLFSPELTAVGVAAPGSPGIGVGRTQHIAYGATVGGSDGTDLYIETLDANRPDHYLEGDSSLPLEIREETIRIKDSEQASGFSEQILRVRSTRRGPLISDHDLVGFDSNTPEQAVSLRWAPASVTTPSIGSDRLLVAKDLDEAREAIKFSPTALSQIVVDQHGGIGRISSGRVPIRTIGDGSRPLPVAKLASQNFDSWNGLIPADEMPVDMRPGKDWVGTANHRIIRADYPYTFSKIFASSWRYRRIVEFMQDNEKLSAQDHWTLINDVKNPMAGRLVDLYVTSLEARQQHVKLATILKEWDHFDHADQIAPSLFQLITKHFVRLTFEDEIPQSIWPAFFDAVYFWQERFVMMTENNTDTWFDIQTTTAQETRDQILQLAIDAALAELTDTLGNDYRNWQWGKIHTITFDSPVIPGKTAARWLGGGTHPLFGSGETLNRGLFKNSKDYDSDIIDSVRLVADLADDEKVLAVIPGGTSGRYFDKSLANQTRDWLAGKANPIWFSLLKVKENSVSQLVLKPD